MNTPTLAVGDLFCITRGFEYGYMGAFSLFRVPGDEWKDHGAPEKKQYDRSWEGCVFRVGEAFGVVVAAEIVFAPSHKKDRVGTRMSLNLTEVVIETVPQNYVEFVKGGPAT